MINMDKLDAYECAVCGAHNAVIHPKCIACDYVFVSARDYIADKIDRDMHEQSDSSIDRDIIEDIYGPDWRTDVKGNL